ncbi:MAG: hypothetical protein NTU98_11045 [Bacteroidetes bacterium]|nr:hypothetical protein [Bacteroidota bacterium]
MKTYFQSNFRKVIILSLIPAVLLVIVSVLFAVTDLQGIIIDIAGEETVIVFFVILCILPALVPLILVGRMFKKKKRETAYIAETGENARAIIQNISMSGSRLMMGADERWGVILELQVCPKFGDSYIAKVQCYIPVLLIPQYQPGKDIAVKIHLYDREKVIIPELG